MYKRLAYLALISAAIIAVVAASIVIRNSYQLRHETYGLHTWASTLGVAQQTMDAQLVAEARERFLHYERLINKTHLVDGMVVNRGIDGEMRDQCDSLLFSALRYVALMKMREFTSAAEAWRAIERSQIDGEWHRHPRCRGQSTSRDMVVGLLAALLQQPPRHEQHLVRLVDYIDTRRGFVGDGPFYISWLTPGVAEIIRQMALHLQVPGARSQFLNWGFSTAEFSLPLMRRGYETHLVAMSLWLELEMYDDEQARRDGGVGRTRGIIDRARHILNFFTVEDVVKQRHEWIAQKLADLDSDNMFFVWLRWRAAGIDSVGVREAMLRELLSMQQFPALRLPANCDRRADYLWQRDSDGYKRQAPECTAYYTGVDFMWLVALLLENDMPAPTLAH